MNAQNEIVIYQMPNGEMQLDVTVSGETIWLTQRQIAELFGTKVPAISKHLKNIFASGELDRDATISKMETVVNRGFRGASIEIVDHYNLDAILSVGYRVNSKNATAFRIWANKILKQYLLQGYAINERIAAQKFDELSQLVKVLGRTIQNQEKLTEDSRSLLNVVVDYTYALDTLDRYDYQELKIEKRQRRSHFTPHAKVPWRLFMDCMRNLAAAHGSVMKKMIHSKAPSGRYTRPLVVLTSIRLLRRKLPCCCILLQRTTHSAMATSVLPLHSSCGFSMATVFFTMRMEVNALPIIPWWR